jgi:hypothetical protein
MKRLACLVSAALIYAGLAQGQDLPDPAEAHSSAQASAPESPLNSEGGSPSPERVKPGPRNDPQELAPKRILGFIPNFRTTPTLKDYRPITPNQKFKLATQDSFDRGTIILSALFAGEGQLSNSTPSFGHGATAYAKYFAASYTDFVAGNYMTEAIYPTILHQDPRFFQRGTGSKWSRFGSAVSQIFYTRTDSGRRQFNFSEILGNSTAVAISNAYYPDNRNASDAVTKLGIQIGVDMAGNILKEFSPELSRMFARKHSEK